MTPALEQRIAAVAAITGWSSGPWENDGRDTLNNHPCFVTISHGEWSAFAQVVVMIDGADTLFPEGVANAQLITAAPEMHALIADLAVEIEAAERRGAERMREKIAQAMPTDLTGKLLALSIRQIPIEEPQRVE